VSRPRDDTLRPRLLEAATIQFAERGYAGVSLDSIAHAVGVTKGGIYFHFRGKEELFFAVLDRLSELRREVLAPTDAPAAGGGAAALRVLLARHLEFHFANPAGVRVMRVLAAEVRRRFTARLRDDAPAAQRALRARLRELLTQGVADGTLFVSDVPLAAFLLVGAVEGILDQWIVSAGEVAPLCDAGTLAAALVAPYETGTIVAAPRAADHARLDDPSFRPAF